MNVFSPNRKTAAAGISILIAAAVMLSSFAFTPAAPVTNDATPTPGPKIQRLNEMRDQLLSKEYQREQKALETQQKRLDKAAQAAEKAQALIDSAKANSKDVADLETALSIFNEQIANAKSVHDTAGAILSTHAGFDDSGNVTDHEAARQTVSDARQSLREAHQILIQAVRDLRQAVVSWRQAHKPASTSGSAY